MIIARGNVRRGVLGLIAAGVLTGVTTAIVVLPTAEGAPDPCSSANLTETISTVNHQISVYLLAHPETNQALADVAKMSPFSAQGAFTDYFKAHPQEGTDLHAIQQPLVDLSSQCGFQVTPGQVLGALSDL